MQKKKLALKRNLYVTVTLKTNRNGKKLMYNYYPPQFGEYKYIHETGSKPESI